MIKEFNFEFDFFKVIMRCGKIVGIIMRIFVWEKDGKGVF